MRKLLNTIYITNEQTYLSLDGENLVCKIDGDIKLRIPFDNVENIVCFNYMGCSPALMGKCVEKTIPINFVSPQGKFLAKVCGETKGNVFLRVSQIEKFQSKTRQLIKRTLHDNEELRQDADINDALETLLSGIEKVSEAESVEEIIGIEGNCAQKYFSIFNKLITVGGSPFQFNLRTKRPPLDPVNAMLSLIYTLITAECASALETVGLDSYIGFCHKLKSGRSSLACDMVEEFRCIAERFVLSTINLKVVAEKDFDRQISGAVWLNDAGRKKVLTRWQEKKRSDIMHPHLKQKIPMGLLPYVQSNLLAKYVRGEIESYPPYLYK